MKGTRTSWKIVVRESRSSDICCVATTRLFLSTASRVDVGGGDDAGV